MRNAKNLALCYRPQGPHEHRREKQFGPVCICKDRRSVPGFHCARGPDESRAGRWGTRVSSAGPRPGGALGPRELRRLLLTPHSHPQAAPCTFRCLQQPSHGRSFPRRRPRRPARCRVRDAAAVTRAQRPSRCGGDAVAALGRTGPHVLGEWFPKVALEGAIWQVTQAEARESSPGAASGRRGSEAVAASTPGRVSWLHHPTGTGPRSRHRVLCDPVSCSTPVASRSHTVRGRDRAGT